MRDRVELRLKGRMLEKFIARAMQENIRLIHVERTAFDEMLIAASSREANRLMGLAEQYRMNLTVLREEGLPVLRKLIRIRGTLAAGVMLGVLLTVLFTSRIWRVQVLSLDGMTDRVTLAAIGQTAYELGATPGTARGLLDRDMLALDIQARWPQLTYVSVRLQGVCLQVEVAEESPAPRVYEIDHSRDLVAARNAVIVHVNALAGKAAVQAGDTVRRGQVVIRGEERIDTELMRGVQALGEVIGRVWFEAECTLPLSDTVQTRTGNTNFSSLIRLNRWEMPLSEAADFASQEEKTELLPIGGLFLPVRIERTIRWETTSRQVPRNPEDMKRQGEAWALELAREKLPSGAQETDYWFDYQEKGGMLTVRATIEAQMDIAAERMQLIGSIEE